MKAKNDDYMTTLLAILTLLGLAVLAVILDSLK